jgi:murein L,D-transpeptidase YcbB/YkuD
MAPRGPQFLLAGTLALVAAGGVLAEEAKPVQSTSTENSAADPDFLLDATSLAIRELLSGSGKKTGLLDPRDAAAMVEFYAERNDAPLWLPDGVMTDKVRALIARIQASDTDGLDSSGFTLPSQDLGRYAKIQPQAAARADLMLSQAVAAYAREAYAGQVDPSTISKNIGYDRRLPDLAAVLNSVATSPDPVETLVAYNPPQPEFTALRERLAELRRAEDAEKPIEIPPGATLKLGAQDARVAFLRKRLDLPSDVRSPAVFDETILAAVKTFQKSAGLKADGIVGPRTLAALNADPVNPIPAILVNMEKWRWMPRDLGRFYVRVNIPDFTVDVYKDDTRTYTTRIVVGKPTQQTPIFSDEIEHTIVNPAWNVPQSITRNEMLPAARRNPGALRGYQVFVLTKGRYRAVDPRRINWRRIDARRIQIRQPPGRRNALGKVKFMFPNRYSVYLHDTPSKSLFNRGYRAYSHGCMRVMNPMEFADALLSEEPELNASYLESLYGSRERRVNLTRKVPVHITYFTAWVDDSGNLQLRDDLYGHDRRIEERLGALSG